MGGSPEDPNAMYGPYDVEKLGETPPPHRVAILQYTGLKDKNGVEIYEGDICRVEYWYTTTQGILPSCRRVWVEVVEWNNSTFYSGFAPRRLYDEVEDKSCGFSMDKGREWRREVIGNIYENPELLEKSK